MIRVDFSEPHTASWGRWRSKCHQATAKLIDSVASGRSVRITSLYKSQKSVWFDRDGAFYGKCAFCEVSIRPGQTGDIEHFRPKKKVTDENEMPVLVTDENGVQVEHPGYYWLAYDWTNLLPACRNCNSLNSAPSGRLFGKGNRFPVDGSHAWKPGQEGTETPLLINPVVDDPGEHLIINETCIISPRNNSRRGQICIRILGLNDREGLLDSRLTEYRNARDKLLRLVEALHFRGTDEQRRLLQEISDIHKGKSPFALAARQAIEDEQRLLAPLRTFLPSG